MKIVYVGPEPSVFIPEVAEFVNGVPTDVPAELGKRLLEQETFTTPKAVTETD